VSIHSCKQAKCEVPPSDTKTAEEDAFACSSDLTLFCETQFMTACRNNQVDLANFCRERLGYKHVMSIIKRDNWALLMEAARNGNTGIVVMISYIDPGTNIFVGNIDHSPLMEAWKNNRLETAARICDERVLTYDDVRDIVFDAYWHACCHGHLEIAYDIYKRFNMRTTELLNEACIRGAVNIVSDLLKTTKLNVNEHVDCFHTALANGRVDIARLLCNSYGRLKIELICSRGMRGLHKACRRGHSDAVIWAVNTFSLHSEDFDTERILTKLGKHPELAYYLSCTYPALKSQIRLEMPQATQ